MISSFFPRFLACPAHPDLRALQILWSPARKRPDAGGYEQGMVFVWFGYGDRPFRAVERSVHRTLHERTTVSEIPERRTWENAQRGGAQPARLLFPASPRIAGPA